MNIKKLWNSIKVAVIDLVTIWSEEMKMCVKDEGVLIFFILVPLLYPLLYSWIYTNEVVRDVPVAVVDNSHSFYSREFLRRCDASPDVKIAYHCNNLEEAKELVGRQIVHGVIYFPHDFDTNIKRGEQTSVGVYCDMSLMLTYKAIYQTTQGIATLMNSFIQIDRKHGWTERDDEVATHPLDFDEVAIFNSTGGYGNALIPCVLIIIIQQTLLLGIGLSAGTARENNRYNNLVPISRHHNGVLRIVAGKALCYLMIYAVLSAYLTLIVPKIFGFTTLASGSALIALLFPFIMSCIFFGMAVSCLIQYRENVILVVVFTSLIFLFMTGISWPQSNFPGYWESISWLLPSTFGVRGFLKISSMGGSIEEIKTEYTMLWVQTIVYFIITCIVYQIQIVRSKRHITQQPMGAEVKE